MRYSNTPEPMAGLGVCDDLLEVTSFASDLDLTLATTSAVGRPARYIRVDTVGADPHLVVVMLAGGAMTTRTLHPEAGREYFGKFCKILDESSNLTKVTVGW